MQRTHLILIAVLGMGLLAGCMDMAVTTEINAEGDVDQMDVEMEMDGMIFGFLEDSAEEEGYDSVEDMLADDFTEDIDEDEVGSVSVSVTSPDERDEDEYLVSMTVEDVPAEEMDDIETTVDEDEETVEFVDTEFGADDDDDDDQDMDMDNGFGEQMEEINMEYVVVMPGEIRDSNADEVDGNTATWDVSEGEEPEEPLFAESTIDEDSDSDSVPGFGVAAGAVALLLSVGLLARRTH